MNHWLDTVAGIITAETGDLKKLAKIAGYDPKSFYKYQNLSGCDLRGQNLSGMDFSGCQLENAIIDDSTIIDEKFDPRISTDNIKNFRARISSDLNTLVLHYMQEKRLKDRDTTYNRLLLEGYECIYSKRFNFYSEIIDGNFNLNKLLKSSKISSIEINFSFDYNLIVTTFDDDVKNVEISKIILVALIRKRIKYKSRKDYSNVSPNAFYPPKLMKVEFG